MNREVRYKHCGIIFCAAVLAFGLTSNMAASVYHQAQQATDSKNLQNFLIPTVGVVLGLLASASIGLLFNSLFMFFWNTPPFDKDWYRRIWRPWRWKPEESAFCFGQVVRFVDQGKDRYGRTIANVFLPDGKNLNQELVRAGIAWWYEKYAPKDEVQRRIEQEARAAKRGLWIDPRPIPPWEWRQGVR